MSATLDLSGLNLLTSRLATLAKLDATPLMRTWMTLIEQDNRLGILAGTDKDGVPMTPVTYRPKALKAPRNIAYIQRGMSHHTKGIIRRVNSEYKTKIREERKQMFDRFRLNQGKSKRKGMFAGLSSFGPQLTLPNNNLSTSEYRLLSGPPLAPRNQFSRVITNLKTTFTSPSHGAARWAAIGAWDEVVDVKGRPFLFDHFNGIGVPRRDLRGVRPGGIVKAVDALRNWARLAVREHFGH